MGKKYPCPCCGYLTLGKDRGNYDICPICFWEDDSYQSERPDNKGGANKVSLNEARENFKRIGAKQERVLKFVRKPLPEEIPPDKK